MKIAQWCLLIVYGSGILFPALPACAGAAQATAGDLFSVLKLEQPLLLCGETVPVDRPHVREGFEREMLLALGNRPQVILWLKRTARYFPHIEQLLRENDLPDDIKYLAVAESALRMHAGSPKGALGVWQLMPETAIKYGLVVNGSVDERRNIYLSTPVALTYLKELYGRFGSWSLSLAAYNMGEGGIEAEILEQGVSDYYRLYLPLETQRFVLRIMAIKRIIESPHNYGFRLDADDYYPPETFATIQIHALTELPLRLVAGAAHADFKTIKDLNPELRGYYLAAGTRMLNIPEEGAPGFQNRLTTMIEADKKIRNQRLYVVKEGDSLSEIARQFDVPLMALLIWNRIGIKNVIHPGQRLVIYPATAEKKIERKNNQGDMER